MRWFHEVLKIMVLEPAHLWPAGMLKPEFQQYIFPLMECFRLASSQLASVWFDMVRGSSSKPKCSRVSLKKRLMFSSKTCGTGTSLSRLSLHHFQMKKPAVLL